MTIEERAQVVTECRPEMATFNCGSFNFGIFGVRHRREMQPWEIDYLESTRDYVFRNTFAGPLPAVRAVPRGRDQAGVRDLRRGAPPQPAHLAEQGLVDFPLHVQFVLGVLGANAASLEQLLHMHRTAVSLFGEDRFTWSAAGVGYPGQFHLAAAALMLGGPHARGPGGQPAGDRWTSARVQTPSWWRRRSKLAPLLDRAPASPDEARELLGLRA